MKKKILMLLSAILVVACILGIAGCGAKEKRFSKAGMHITLTTEFYEKELDGQTAYWESARNIAIALKESYTDALAENVTTLSEYTDAVITINKIKNADVHTREGKDYLYFTYDRSVSGKNFFYLATTHLYEADSFWLIQFACEAKYKEDRVELFLGWADSVCFGDTADV